ncbi:hypothetical protein [Tepidibacter formicigenes]|uniref:Heat induced stress protein YflT n=1 Tax=Tepidibacter formicigenes DSM 15518 TaxID=1123349 RepID=A0A1M6TNK6_9FIRM|nr:hypothetical protein [Tepidibacter formicigenes]SHK58476.1 hypothetical protein SAMN02744037_02642 [Tepidibacter formicigenes DSM 15518]
MRVEIFFHNIKEANKVLDELKKVGFNNSFFDIEDKYIKDRNVDTNEPGMVEGSSLGELVLESGNGGISRSKAPFAAANPSVSGMSTGDDVMQGNYKVVVETKSSNENKSINKIKEVRTKYHFVILSDE